MPDVFIDSFGARWQDPPPPRYRAAVLGINLTNALLNQPDDPALADIVAHQTRPDQTRQDADVRDYVLNTPGARELLANLIDYAGLPTGPRRIAIGCVGGRHRAAGLTELPARALRERGRDVEVEHLHSHLPGC
ncbi:hypothetical protein ACIRU5_35695 [Streptomyces misionensis]|uniref:RapZ C-terminal domain-containing protein n=1 Tax=Streptomyces misionensis TaxID=67331 RepID=UPI00381D7DE1